MGHQVHFFKTLKYKVQCVAAPGEFLLHGSRVSPEHAKQQLNKDISTGDSLHWTHFSPSHYWTCPRGSFHRHHPIPPPWARKPPLLSGLSPVSIPQGHFPDLSTETFFVVTCCSYNLKLIFWLQEWHSFSLLEYGPMPYSQDCHKKLQKTGRLKL